jgi:hypothetical protein
VAGPARSPSRPEEFRAQHIAVAADAGNGQNFTQDSNRLLKNCS